uniref:Uncharacterized protein n=1 Tax=Alexandrium monilatum TaxID=311494 RepID=A0A7S4WDS0_9DINO|mmetsp:Transcript_15552/g.49832  ORF Transcript_15552/g.49832 Transcript_15552/m.49832 type:complete len:637 (+) Transcript_15552:53-1963(+)
MVVGRGPAEGLPWRPLEDYEVVHEKVAVRERPSLSAQALAVLRRGRVVAGARHDVRGEPWLCLSGAARKGLAIHEDGAWVLIHGRSVGLGELLRARPREQLGNDARPPVAKWREAPVESTGLPSSGSRPPAAAARPAGPPLPAGTDRDWRLGEGLWHAAAVAPVCGPSEEPAPWAKRSGFRVTSLGPLASAPRSPPVLLVMGGQVGPLYRNDVWRSDDEGRRWQEASPHEDGRRSGSGFEAATKWAAREGFACASGWSSRRGGKQSVVYVACGVGARSAFADVWASEDLGRTWSRTCAAAPFGRRKNPGLAVCPDSPLKLVLCGGMPWAGESVGAAGVVIADCWLSDDAGFSWTRLNFPLAVPPRAGPVVAFTTASTLLIMGGLGDSKYASFSFLPSNVEHEALSDIYVARIDWSARRALWAPLTVRTPMGFTCFSAVFDRRCGEFMAFSRPSEVFLGRVPEEVLLGRLEDNGIPMTEELEELEQYCSSCAAHLAEAGSHMGRPPAAVCAADPRQPGDEKRDWREVEVRVERLPHMGVPLAEEAFFIPLLPADGLRLVVLSEDRVLATPGRSAEGVPRSRPAPSMLRRQWVFLWWLGRQLEQQVGMPSELWARVVAALFDATWRWCAGGVPSAMKR